MENEKQTTTTMTTMVEKTEIMPGKCNENNIEIITLCILDTLITEQISARERLNCDATSGVVFQEKKN